MCGRITQNYTYDELRAVLSVSAWMTPYHDRMPILLGPEARQAWLAGTLGPEALQPASEDALRAWPVSSRVNRTGEGDDDPALILPTSLPA